MLFCKRRHFLNTQRVMQLFPAPLRQCFLICLAIILLLVGAVYFILSTGDPGRVKRAKDIIQNTIIGLVIIIMAYGAVTLVTAAI